jgi:hypothetical protein
MSCIFKTVEILKNVLSLELKNASMLNTIKLTVIIMIAGITIHLTADILRVFHFNIYCKIITMNHCMLSADLLFIAYKSYPIYIIKIISCSLSTDML